MANQTVTEMQNQYEVKRVHLQSYHCQINKQMKDQFTHENIRKGTQQTLRIMAKKHCLQKEEKLTVSYFPKVEVWIVTEHRSAIFPSFSSHEVKSLECVSVRL